MFDIIPHGHVVNNRLYMANHTHVFCSGAAYWMACPTLFHTRFKISLSDYRT